MSALVGDLCELNGCAGVIAHDGNGLICLSCAPPEARLMALRRVVRLAKEHEALTQRLEETQRAIRRALATARGERKTK